MVSKAKKILFPENGGIGKPARTLVFLRFGALALFGVLSEFVAQAGKISPQGIVPVRRVHLFNVARLHNFSPYRSFPDHSRTVRGRLSVLFWQQMQSGPNI